MLSRLPHWQYSKCPGTPNDNTYVLVPHRPCRRGVTCNPFILFLHIILVTCMCVPDCRDSTDSFLFINSNIFHSTNVIYSLSDRYCLTQKHILETVLKYIHIQKFYWHPGRKIRTTHEFLSINTECQKILEQ